MRFLFLFTIAFLFFGCSDQCTMVYLKSDSGEGIYVSMPVFYRDKKGGKVIDVSVDDSFAIIQISLEKSTTVCRTSDFNLIRLNFLDKGIRITNTCSKSDLRSGDTILVHLECRSEEKSFYMYDTKSNSTETDSVKLDSIHVWVEE